MCVATPGDCPDTGHGASEAVNTATRPFSGAVVVADRCLSVPLFGGTKPLGCSEGRALTGHHKAPLRRGFSRWLSENAAVNTPGESPYSNESSKPLNMLTILLR